MRDPSIHPGAELTSQFARSSRLVVVSAGAMGSPAILERSGIGATDILARANVPQILDLPGVGENYRILCWDSYIHISFALG